MVSLIKLNFCVYVYKVSNHQNNSYFQIFKDHKGYWPSSVVRSAFKRKCRVSAMGLEIVPGTGIKNRKMS